MRLDRTILAVLVCAAALHAGEARVWAQAKVLKIGVIYDYTGPLAAGGSELNAWGTKLAIDMINERGGVEGYKIAPTYADAQSKVDVAINEAERMLDQIGVDMLMGLFSSAQCVPLAAKVDTQKKFFWINTCISPAVLKDRHLKYVFRPQIHGGQFGELSPEMLSHFSKSKLGIEPKDLKIAIIHEDGPFGVGVAEGNERAAKKYGMQVVHKEGYSATTPDLSSLVTKLKRANPDIVLHTAYNPDITLFLRQAREQGFRFKALFGHGAGYGEADRMVATFGTDINYFMDSDAVSSALLNPDKLRPDIAKLVKDVEAVYLKAFPKATELPVHVSVGFNSTWIFLTDVLPRAIKKHGGISAEALRQAALETDIPDGSTFAGYGVKFHPPEHEMAGQNMRSTPVVWQYVDGKSKVVFPIAIASQEPVLPLPASSPYGSR
jgi:branched-chain amino acid transport system substrate-binding protein